MLVMLSQRTRLIWIFVLILYGLRLTASLGLFPKMEALADYAPINSSSTCGTPSIQVCRSSSQISSLDVCTEDTCKFACCPTCSKDKPSPSDLGNNRFTRKVGIVPGESRPGSSDTSFRFESSSNSHMDPLNIPGVNYKTKGFSLSAWVKQKENNKGTLFSKGTQSSSYKVIFQLEIENYKIWFHYQYGSGNTSVVELNPLQSQSQHLNENEWHFITVTVINTDISYFIDGQFIKATSLKGSIKDDGGRIRIGQKYGGGSQYEGLMQDLFMYGISLTNREVVESYSGKLPKAYVASECRCPPAYPKIMESSRAKCTKNGESSSLGQSESRLAVTAHPIELATDGDTTTYWQSELTNDAVVSLELKYGEMQIFYIILEFYGPQPGAIKIERSRNGHTFQPWQYFAENCVKSFNMPNNGPLAEPDSVNCIQYELPMKLSLASISFKTEQAPAQGSPVPIRPFGSPCTNLYCSKKLLEFLKASHVRFSFYNHTLVKNEKHRYFALNRIVAAGRCECFGHAREATYNATHKKCVCQCVPSTFTAGEKCDRCQPLYNNKAFRRGSNSDSFPCIKCQCNDHASRCYYNESLDPNTKSRTNGGGGVCIDCKHNTTGRYCHICEETFYRESGKSLSARDVCTPCECTGPGVLPNRLDCVKDDSIVGVKEGQCECKNYTQGRQCDECKPGYFDLKSSHVTGCVSCQCNTAGTESGNTSCHATTGQCDCKSNVIGVKCDTCRSGFYGLSSLEPTGCKACGCDPFGSLDTLCDKTTGQCSCKVGSTGLRCDQCADGYHSLGRDGCKSCNCSSEGSKPNLLSTCQKSDGQCYCKTNAEGKKCDRCRVGYYNLSSSNPNGCTPCTCDPKGTVGMSSQCESMSGNCTCKRHVIGVNCNQCQPSYFNISLSNPVGCQSCNCFLNGTKDPQSNGILECTSNGQCDCLSNVRGRTCDACASQYYWNPSGKGCVQCNCDLRGSIGTNCNISGQCQCKPNIGGLRCDRCLPGNYGFSSGTCRPCGCNAAGSRDNTCDDTGKCTSCKKNVQGNKCDSCKSGTINLQANNEYGCSGVPSQQAPPFVNILSSRALEITWNRPDNPNGPIIRYELYRNGSLIYNKTARAFNDTGLTPNTYYYYYIITYTEAGSTRSNNRVSRTPEDAPEGIAAPVMSVIKARSAEATWQKPNITNGVITRYRLVSVNSFSSSEVVHCQGQFILRCDVSSLKPFTVYNFTVVVCNQGGCGRSLPTQTPTRPSAPDFQPMPNVTLIPGGRSVYATWDEPPVPNGEVFRYELYMRASPFSGGGQAIKPDSPVDVRNTTVTNLVPYTLYEFRVVAFTAMVNGDTSSDWKRIRTAEGVPAGESAIQPQSSAVASDAIEVTWSPPSSPYGKIVLYRIKASQQSSGIVSEKKANGTDRASVVRGLSPYTTYRFTVVACNSYQCTRESSSTSARTLPAAPMGQGAPNITRVSSSSISLTWAQPKILNGPLPPSYNVTRSPAAFNHPPQEVTAGVHFPGLGFYKFPANFVGAGAENKIELSFRTKYPDGLILFLASDGNQEDLLAIELREGKPWFIFDCQDGPAAFTIRDSVRFDDNKWHYLRADRRNSLGTLTVDGVYSNTGTSTPSSTYIGGYTGVYIGGLPSDFVITRKDSGNAVIRRHGFIGCLKEVKSNFRLFDWTAALEKKGVDPELNACPVSGNDRGAFLRGGGFIALKSGDFNGGVLFVLELSFRTQFRSGILLFAYGPSSHVAIHLLDGRVNVKLRGTTNHTSVQPSDKEVCDGKWHHIRITALNGFNFVISVDGNNNVIDPITYITINSDLFMGGVPVEEEEVFARVKNAGIDPHDAFGGCLKDLKTSTTIYLNKNVIKMRNADLDGCASDAQVNATLSAGGGLCQGRNSTDVVTQTTTRFADSSVKPFTDYLYGVESFHQGTTGSAKSVQVWTRSGQGAPSGISPPTTVLPLDDGRSVRVTWRRPERPNGLIIYYHIIAQKLLDGTEVVTKVTDTENLNSTITGLIPYTVYDIKIAAFTRGGNTTGPAVNTTTKEAAPEGVPVPTADRYPRTLVLSWTLPSSPNGIITRYNLTSDGASVYIGADRQFNITGLDVYTLYTLQLTACTKVGCSSGPRYPVYTGELPPSGLSLPTLFVEGNDTLRVQWNEPTEPNGVIRKYEVHISTTEELGPNYENVYNGSRSDLSAVIAKLTTGTLYYVRVKAINGGGGTFSNASSARTISGIPTDIPAPRVTALNHSSLHVEILPPGKPNGIITRYELYQDKSLTPVINETSLTNYTAVGFKVYSLHTFWVRACTIKGCNRGVEAKAYTGELPPNGTVQLSASVVSATEVQARWTAVAQPNGNLFYHLMINGSFLVPGSTKFETEIRIENRLGQPGKDTTYGGLLPNNSYVFWVNASNTVGYILSNEISGKTPESVPQGIVPPIVTVLSSSAVNVTWQEPYLPNGLLIGYKLYQKTGSDGNETIIYSGYLFTRLVTGLEPFTRYHYRIGARTVKGTGLGNWTSIITHEAVPGPLDAPRLKPDSKAMILEWDRPSKPNGIIQLYSIYMNDSFLWNVTGNATSYRVTGLAPFTWYVFAVSACNSAGCTRSSYSRPSRTLESVPSGLSKPVLKALSPRSVEIQWSVPNVTNGIIIHYSIDRRRAGEATPINITKVPASRPRVYVDNTAPPFTSLEYRVVAYTGRGGTPSPYSNVSTGEGDPENIRAPILTAVSAFTLNARWSAPGTPNGYVINYIVRVLETAANFSMNSSNILEYTITGLRPYKLYSIVVSACTIGGCGDSPPSQERTLTDEPSGQPAPSGIALSSTTIRVVWDPPSDPNSPIRKYELYRKTIEEPVNPNFTAVNGYVRRYSGIQRTFDDPGLGIYSLQQYKVIVYTTTGNSSSPTADLRSGPASPLAGPAVNASAINHTTVLVTWNPPPVALLRGSVKVYTVFHENVKTGFVHQFGSVPGNQTSLAVTGLKPSTDYRFWVVLDNTAGTSKSVLVNQRTLDGVPEGFGAPELYVTSSTKIRVSWKEPTTPNGKITVYLIYANDESVTNVSASSTQVILSFLVPYTEYIIRVEVCTVYACTKSPPSSVRTHPSAPEGLAPPRLTPGPNFMDVNWKPPSRPNGPMAKYMLFRSKIYNCPTAPPPVAKCTYIECNISQELCGRTCFNPRNKICCSGVLRQRDPVNPSKQCCGIAYVSKNNPDDVCCGNTFHVRKSDFQCCYDNYLRVPTGSVCCRRGDGGVAVGAGDTCCGDRPYFVNGKKVCVCDGLYERSPPRQCCGGKVIASAQVCCGSQSLGIAYDLHSEKTCCGNQYVTNKTSLCCEGTLGEVKVYNYSSFADKNSKAEKCCNLNKVSKGLSCCNTIGYNSTYQTCADRSSKGETDCGSGVVCDKAQESSARCNRCDFSSSTLLCGSTKGYYKPTAVPTTPRICASQFQELSVPTGPSVLSFRDNNLSPHTEYQYYVVGINAEGNTISERARNRTLMASPDGLAPPVATAISSSAIRVTWKPPSVMNGELKSYNLIRINQQTNERKKVYTGLSLTYTDSSGLEPFTGYKYELQACTTECTRVISTTVTFTDESSPSVVGAPTLLALSSTSINVSWSLPPKPNGRIIRYNISQIINSTYKVHLNPNDKGLSMSLTVNNLKPYKNYTFQVTACTKIGCKEGPSASVLTLEAAPEDVRPPTLVALGAREIEATWFEPGVPNGIVYLYTLYRNNTIVYNGTDNCSMSDQGKYKCIYRDQGLNPMTVYNYYVAATTNGGTTRSSTVSAQTPESSPEGIPLPTLNPRSANSIYAEWTSPSTPNGIITQYAIIVDGTEHSTGLTKTKLVENLKPYTRYEFRVKACTSKGCGIGDRAYARTLEAAPAGVNPPRLEAKEWNVVSISWDEPGSPNGIVTKHKVERRHGNEVPLIVCLKTGVTLSTRTCLDSGGSLKGYTQYDYRILSENNAGIGYSSWTSVRTMEGPPQRIKQPTVYVINATAVTAFWEAPLDPNGVIIHYELRYQALNVLNSNISVAGRVNSSTFSMTVNILKPNTDYQFLIAAINNRREGVSSWTSAKTKEAPPADLKPLNAERLPGGSSLRLYWDQPGSPNGIITHYNIYKDNVKIFEGKTREYVVTKLTPYTEYEFQLEACTSAGCTKGDSKSIYSAEVNPTGQAAPIRGFVNSTVVVLNWRQPVVPNGVIQRFDVLRRTTTLQARKRRSVSEDIIYSTNKTNETAFTYTDSGLKPYTRYQYKIRAVNNGGQTDSDWLTIDTKEAPPSYMNPPNVITLDAYRLNVTWRKPDNPNGVIQYYLVYRNGTIIHKGSNLHFVDKGLEPYTVYSYTISACSGGGCKESMPAIQRTDQVAPAQVSPPTLKILSAIAIRIEWKIPGKPNGIITAYKVYEGIGSTPIYSGKDYSFTVSGKKPYTEYTFSVEACTRAGCTRSISAKTRTLESPPGAMAAPVATVAGSRTVRVEWTPPTEPNGVIRHYILSRNGILVYNGTDVRYNDYDVAPYTVYEYKIYAVNNAGRGVDSPIGRNPPTNPGAPDNITAPLLTVLGSNSIRVKWEKPGRPNGNIVNYYVMYNNKEKNALLALETVLDGLEPYTLYEVRIKACTNAACSVGEVAKARTSEAAPMLQGRPVFPSESILARSVNVIWSEPAKPNGFIIMYTLYRRKVIRTAGVQTSYGSIMSVHNASNGTQRAFTDKTVLPYSEYEYRVTSINSKGSAASGWAVVKTLPDVPENVSAPEVTKKFQDRFEVAIKAPLKPNGEIRNYVLIIAGKNVSEGLETARVISNLKAFTLYNIQVSACTDAGCTISPGVKNRTTEGIPTQFGAPTAVKIMSRSVDLAWNETVKPNGIITWYEVLHRKTCVKGSSCETPVNGTNVGLEKNATVENLMPFITYDFIIRVYNGKYSGLSDVKAVRTLPEDPVALADSPPRVNVTGFHVSVAWGECFILNGPLDEYTLLEKGVIVFRGRKTSNNFPNRARGEYTYEVIATTIVNGVKKTARSPKVTVTVPKEGIVSPPSTALPQTAPFYRTIWFIAVIVLIGLLLLFLLLALCLRKRTGDRTVYVREREPLPPRTKMRSRPPSMSSLYSSSERKGGSMIDLNTFHNGSTVALFDGSGTPIRGTPKPDRYDSIDRYERYNRINRSIDLSDGSLQKFGMDESSDWNDIPRAYSYSNKDSGFFMEDKLPLSDSDEESTPRHSFKREQYFTDTHL